MERERSIDFCIRSKSTASEIFGDIVNQMEDSREPAYHDVLDILLDFSDADAYPETDEYHMVLRAKADGGKIRCSVFFKESVYGGGYARQIAEQWLMLLPEADERRYKNWMSCAWNQKKSVWPDGIR